MVLTGREWHPAPLPAANAALAGSSQREAAGFPQQHHGGESN